MLSTVSLLEGCKTSTIKELKARLHLGAGGTVVSVTVTCLGPALSRNQG